MRLHTFQAASAQDAVAQIRRELGPSAIVLNVRRVPAPGLAGWLRRPRIEIVAALPAPEPNAETQTTLEELKRELSELRVLMRQQTQTVDQSLTANLDITVGEPDPACTHDGVTEFLCRMGLLPACARQIAGDVAAASARAGHGGSRPRLEALRAALVQRWRPPAPVDPGRLQVLIGPPGAGKSLALCKWLARAVLRENRPARVWWWESGHAGSTETLRLYGEILQVPVERAAPTAPLSSPPGGMAWLEIPGLPWQNPAAMRQWSGRLAALPNPQIHLVLNSAYDTSLLMQQARAFAALPMDSLILTHLDEQPRIGKLWNLVCGTNFSLRFLCGGQNIPGDFAAATPQALLPAVLARETSSPAVSTPLIPDGKAFAKQALAEHA